MRQKAPTRSSQKPQQTPRPALAPLSSGGASSSSGNRTSYGAMQPLSKSTFAPKVVSTPAASAAISRRGASAAAKPTAADVPGSPKSRPRRQSLAVGSSSRPVAADAAHRPRISASPEARAAANSQENESSQSEAEVAARRPVSPGGKSKRRSMPVASQKKKVVSQQRQNSAVQRDEPERIKQQRRQQQQHRSHRRKRHIEREICYFQSTTNFLIQRAPFMRIVREITANLKHNGQLCVSPGVGDSWQSAAIAALQTMAESYIVQILSDANRLCNHRSRVTVSKADLVLICELCSQHGP